MSSGNAFAGRGASQQPNWLTRGAMIAVIGFVLLLIYVAMQGNKHELSIKYGQRRGLGAGDSVNGTAALAALFEQKGHRVHSSTSLNSRLDRYDTIVWAPDDFDAPADDVRQFLNSWLGQKPGRTLVYIGRDYDGASEYWQRMLAEVDDDRHDEYQRLLAHAESEFAYRRAAMPAHERGEWFTIDTNAPARRIPDLDGPWATGVDASKTDIVLDGRLDLPDETDPSTSSSPGIPGDTFEPVEILLQSENDILAHRFQQRYWNSSQVVVVANGSFTLNIGLVNKEHRKLAAKLVDQCGKPGAVTFLESGPSGLSIDKSNPMASNNHALRIFAIWPVSFIFIHFAALGIAYCISVFPIFGRPQTLPGEGRSDFGQHVAALGELLQKTKDAFFAESRIKQYQTQSKRTSGQSHRAAATPAMSAKADVKITPAPTIFQPPPADSAKPTS